MLRRILVATDFSPSAQHALDRAQKLAAQCGAELLLLHVRDEFPFTRPDGSGHVPIELERLQAEAVERQLREQASSVHGVPVATTSVLGAPHLLIPEVADREQCQLIVLGHVHDGAMSHALRRSVSDRVIRTANVPVMTVPLPKPGAPEST